MHKVVVVVVLFQYSAEGLDHKIVLGWITFHIRTKLGLFKLMKWLQLCIRKALIAIQFILKMEFFVGSKKSSEFSPQSNRVKHSNELHVKLTRLLCKHIEYSKYILCVLIYNDNSLWTKWPLILFFRISFYY